MPGDVKLGSTGNDVILCQKCLANAGFYKGKIDGSSGPVTVQAIKLFQSSTGHTPDGWCGAKTWSDLLKYAPAGTAILTPVASVQTINDCLGTTLQIGSKGQCVGFLQQKLQDFGLYTRQVDNDYGQYTQQAVIAFQNLTGHTPDGICGPKTWSSVPGYVAAKPGVIEGDSWVLSELQKLGPINTLQNFRDIIARFFKYVFYYDQQQSQRTTVLNRRGNCADLVNDVGAPVARSKGWNVKIIHCLVKCSDGQWYGHYLLLINGVLCDIAGWAKGKQLGQLICGTGTPGVDYTFQHYEGNYVP